MTEKQAEESDKVLAPNEMPAQENIPGVEEVPVKTQMSAADIAAMLQAEEGEPNQEDDMPAPVNAEAYAVAYAEHYRAAQRESEEAE